MKKERREKERGGFTGRRRALRRTMSDHEPSRHATRQKVKKRRGRRKTKRRWREKKFCGEREWIRKNKMEHSEGIESTRSKSDTYPLIKSGGILSAAGRIAATASGSICNLRGRPAEYSDGDNLSRFGKSTFRIQIRPPRSLILGSPHFDQVILQVACT